LQNQTRIFEKQAIEVLLSHAKTHTHAHTHTHTHIHTHTHTHTHTYIHIHIHTQLVVQFGNPHSRTHYYGWESEEAMETARGEVRRLCCMSSMMMSP